LCFERRGLCRYDQPSDEGFADGDQEGFNDGADDRLILGFLDGAKEGAGDDPDDAMKGTLDSLISIPNISGFSNL
jgi:hypothetical protein